MKTSPQDIRSDRDVSDEELREIARDAYIYAYPLVLMQVSRQVSTNVAQPTGLLSPINQFAHGREFPDPSFTVVVRPNADTLYSSLNFDVSKEPLVLSVPDSTGRFYLLPMLDYWTDVFGSARQANDGYGRTDLCHRGPQLAGNASGRR